MLQRVRLSAFLLATGLSLGASGQIVVTNNQTVEYYVQNILLGSGVTAFNITFNGVPANQISSQVGSFTCANCNVGLPDGFLMASGDAQVVVGPNDSPSESLGGGTSIDGPDPDLNAISTGFGINDWAILEFDFIPQGDSVKFNYVWGSEEYMEWVNSSFNDVFGFFLSGPGINGPYSNSGINIALVPGTNLPVTIDNVNAFVNGAYYVDNGDGFTAPFSTNNYYIQFDGITVPLEASAQVQCGQTYHIKLACADSGDTNYDCGVFFEEGSFASPVVAEATVENAPPFLPAGSVLEGCVNGTMLFYPPSTLEVDSLITLTIEGSAINGVDYTLVDDELLLTPEIPSLISIVPLYDDVVEGTEEILISYIFLNSCGELDTALASLFIVDYVPMTLSLDDLFICPGTVNTAVPQLANGAPNFSYAWSTEQTSSTVVFEQGDAGSYSLVVTDYCENTVNADFEVIEPIPFSPIDSTEICRGAVSVPLATGGALPYTYVYDETGLLLTSQEAVFSGEATGSFTVTITDACNQSAEIPVLVKQCETKIPNIFSPNGDKDKLNESFEIFGLEAFPNSSLYVYNRWGGLVYESENYGNKWDGDELEEGVYFYVFKRSDGKNFEGFVHLVR